MKQCIKLQAGRPPERLPELRTAGRERAGLKQGGVRQKPEIRKGTAKSPKPPRSLRRRVR